MNTAVNGVLGLHGLRAVSVAVAGLADDGEPACLVTAVVVRSSRRDAKFKIAIRVVFFSKETSELYRNYLISE